MVKKYRYIRSAIYSFFFLLSCFQSFICINAKNNHNQNEPNLLDETGELALETFSNTVNCMFNIVHQPNNKQNVISNIGAIIGGIFNFVAQAVSQNTKTGNLYKNIDKQLNELLEKIVEQYFQKYFKNPESLQENIERTIIANSLHLKTKTQ